MTHGPDETAGPPANPSRLITPEALALLCRMQRDNRGWSQETLAELTGLQVRTIQRVEKGEPSSADTRRALARAFGAEDLDAFNKPHVFPSLEETKAHAKAQKEAFERDYMTLALTPATGILLIRELNGCGAFGADVVDDDLLRTREARDAWGAFVDNAKDWGDAADLAGESDRMAAADQFDEQIGELARTGIALHVGSRELVSGHGDKALRFRAVHVVGAPKGRTITEIATPKKVEMGW